MLNNLSSAFRVVARLNPASRGVLATSRANPRLSLISRHLDQRLPLPALNTPFSTERTVSVEPDDIEYKPLQRTPPLLKQNTATPTSNPKDPNAKMSTQAPHSTLLIPGPIEFDDAVLQSMSHYACVLLFLSLYNFSIQPTAVMPQLPTTLLKLTELPPFSLAQ